MTPRRVLIAGCGYIGSALALRLSAEGIQVTALRRSALPIGDGISLIKADLVKGTGMAALTDEYDTVFYTVGADGFTEESYRNAYVTGLQNLLGAFKVGPKRLLFTSSTGVYAQDGGEVVDENSPTNPSRFSGRVLLEGEALVHQSAMGGVVVRFGGIYGPGRSRLLDSVRAGTTYALSDRTQYLNLIHRDDCVGVLRHLMLLEHCESLYNAVDDTPMERGDLISALSLALGMPVASKRPASDTTEPQRGGNRRISNARIRSTGYVFAHPDPVSGYLALIPNR